MNLNFKHVRYGSRHYRNIKQLYFRSFPEIEQFPLYFLCLMALRPGIEFYAIYDCNDFCGLLYLVNFRGKTLMYYFAVGDNLRNKGYGAEILKWIRDRKSSVSLIMESMHETCDNARQRERRKNFYLRNGFQDTGYYMKDAGGLFDILSTDPEITSTELKKLTGQLSFQMQNIKIGKF